MGRENQRQFFRDGFIVVRQNPVAGWAVNFLVVVDEQSVMKDCDISFFFELAVLEDRGIENNVKCLPLAGLAAGVYHRRGLPVNRGGLAVRIELLRVLIENLYLE